MKSSRVGRKGRAILATTSRSRSRRWRARLVALGIGGVVGVACALDLPTLDKVSVMVSLDQVREIAGAPDEMADEKVEIWNLWSSLTQRFRAG